jgi:hypothetical protein
MRGEWTSFQNHNYPNIPTTSHRFPTFQLPSYDQLSYHRLINYKSHEKSPCFLVFRNHVAIVFYGCPLWFSVFFLWFTVVPCLQKCSLVKPTYFPMFFLLRHRPVPALFEGSQVPWFIPSGSPKRISSANGGIQGGKENTVGVMVYLWFIPLISKLRRIWNG